MRTIEELERYIADELVWRRKELTEMRAFVQSAKGKLTQRVLIRAAVALLYAHWEGFVKKSGCAYLKFVAGQGINCGNLSYNFLALAGRKLSPGEGGMRLSVELAKYYSESGLIKAKIPHSNIVDTKSNLGSSALKDILFVLGLEESHFSTKMAFIDSNLVRPRNYIAHGEIININVHEYENVHAEVLALIEEFRNAVENAAATKRYLRS
ncbi:MAE_28990/MAE_18760 family HEPN-like nuclease [Xanthomonas campestris pv. raphani]|nr:MAE_28990/MAE_18760 family HEPN-like nuclease [Xanthomonas campestris pv. raphani]